MVLQSGAGRVHTWPCVRSLHAHTAELMPDSLSCPKAAAPEVRVAFHARTGPASQLEKVLVPTGFCPEPYLCYLCLETLRDRVTRLPVCLNTIREDFAEVVPQGFC